MRSIYDANRAHQAVVSDHDIGHDRLRARSIGCALHWQLHPHHLRVAGTAQRIAEHQVRIAGLRQRLVIQG